eukprot:Filipodium_phascolosomae@DN1143_c0_g1_i1.p1
MEGVYIRQEEGTSTGGGYHEPIGGERKPCSNRLLFVILAIVVGGGIWGLAIGALIAYRPVAVIRTDDDGRITSVTSESSYAQATKKGHHKGHSGKGGNGSGSGSGEVDRSLCESKDFTSIFLKSMFEMSFAGLFRDTKGEKKFEASDIVLVGDSYWAVCDNSWALEKLHSSLTPFSEKNVQVGNPKGYGKGKYSEEAGQDSGWEALVFLPENGNFLAVRESIESEMSEETSFRAVVQELHVDNLESPQNYTIVEECETEFEFTSSNKGFEGAISLRNAKGERFLIGLCEGNYCDSGARGRDPGHGRLVFMTKTKIPKKMMHLKERHENNNKHQGSDSGESKCMWKTVMTLDLSPEAKFVDYSAVAIRGSRLVVTSQESSSLWIGDLEGLVWPSEVLSLKKTGDGGEKSSADMLFGEHEKLLPENLKSVKLSTGKVLNFPRNDNCQVQYCNIEGIHFIGPNVFIAVSDKMKSGGRQPFECLSKDQSVHAFHAPIDE